jgi:hypothetical protein
MGHNGPSRSRRRAMSFGIQMDWERAQEAANQAQREADAKYIELWNARMACEGVSIQPSPTIGMALNAGYRYLRVRCKICRTSAFKELGGIRRPRSTEIWKLEASLFCEPCRERGARSPRGIVEQLTREKTYGWAAKEGL